MNIKIASALGLLAASSVSTTNAINVRGRNLYEVGEGAPGTPGAGGGDTEIREGGETILLIGDSWADYADESMEDIAFCDTVNVYDAGFGGTTAAEWATGGVLATKSFGSISLVDVPVDYKLAYDAAKEATGTAPTKVWVSLGGNDFLGHPTCSPEIAIVKENIVKVLDQIKDVDDSVKVLLTGYGAMSSLPVGACTDITVVQQYNDDVLKVAEEYDDLDITYVNVWDSFKTKESGDYSDSKFYQDSIHLDAGGYSRFWSISEVNEFMCEPPTDTGLVVGLVAGVGITFAGLGVAAWKM